MKQIPITNKQIGLFMGGRLQTRFPMAHHQIWLPVHGICRWDTVEIGKGKIMKYHKSWDWLIPVIDRIISLDSYPDYVSDTSSILHKGGVFVNTSSILRTYANVADFVLWSQEKDLVTNYPIN